VNNKTSSVFKQQLNQVSIHAVPFHRFTGFSTHALPSQTLTGFKTHSVPFQTLMRPPVGAGAVSSGAAVGVGE
jgi:hypothetical protein